jgi:hypothetical protein
MRVGSPRRNGLRGRRRWPCWAQRKATDALAPAKHPGHLYDVDALLAPRWSGYEGAPALFSCVFIRQLLTHLLHEVASAYSGTAPF